MRRWDAWAMKIMAFECMFVCVCVRLAANGYRHDPRHCMHTYLYVYIYISSKQRGPLLSTSNSTTCGEFSRSAHGDLHFNCILDLYFSLHKNMRWKLFHIKFNSIFQALDLYFPPKWNLSVGWWGGTKCCSGYAKVTCFCVFSRSPSGASHRDDDGSST